MPTQPADPAWGVPDKSESRIPASIAILVALVLYVTLPRHLTLGPRWIVPVLELALLVPLLIMAPRRKQDEGRGLRVAAIVLIAIINVANVASLVLLVHFLTTPGNKATGLELLAASASIWFTNIIVFALWYWELDRGGPHERLKPTHRAPDFLFPQMVTPGCAGSGWSPQFIDYLFVSFTNASAFSPTDTMPLTPAAKMLFLVQAVTSLLTVALVAARAVNILS
jgi:uncharacterized membrane protein